jgi:hypothetical protein
MLNEDAVFLHVLVERVDGDGSVLDDNFIGSSYGYGSVANFQGGVDCCEVGGTVC